MLAPRQGLLLTTDARCTPRAFYRLLLAAHCSSTTTAWLQAFVGLFKPLFPKSVQARLKFERAPFLTKLDELTPLTTDKAQKDAFLKEVADLLK